MHRGLNDRAPSVRLFAILRNSCSGSVLRLRLHFDANAELPQ
jgi:hypothetical protein